MSIQGVFYSSLTSLTAQQSEISLISNNIANATTSGYSAQNYDETAIIYNGMGAGVATGTVQRATNAALTNAANQAVSSAAYSQQMTDALSNYSNSLTSSETSTTDNGSTVAGTDVLSTAMSDLQSALSALSDSPGDSTAQNDAVNAANSLVSTFHTLDTAISSARETADSNINTEVKSVNSDLNALAQNEIAIQKAAALGQSTASLQDTRDKLVSDISQYVPVKELQNSNGTISLVTDGGTTLYDSGVVHSLSFTATPVIPDTLGVTADAANGISAGLSQVTVDGQPLQSSANGSIAANLQLRDVTLPQFAGQLNELAGNVISAFQSADPSVTSGQTGLFTVSGSAMTSTTTTAGLASSIEVNAAVDPSQGGEAWRVQFGAQATTEGGSSDTSTVQDYLTAMGTSQSYSSASGVSSTDMVTASAQIAGLQQNVYADWSTRNDTRTSQMTTAQTAASNATGVNVDEQMQRLLIVQQTYAASSEVMQIAAKMLDTLNAAVSAVA